MNNHDIDMAIAKHLFGHEYPGGFSTSCAYVGGILEALRKRDFIVDFLYDTCDDKPNCVVVINRADAEIDSEFWVGEEETLPLALCKAALKALGRWDE